MQPYSVLERVPEGQCGSATVEHFTVSPDEAARYSIRREDVRPGRYARLRIDGRLWMSDTPMEQYTNSAVIYHANGDVLIAGLGLGMILPPILAKPAVRSVLVVERSQDVIDLIAPHYAHPKLTVERGDIYTWRLPPGCRWDTIYFDIWADISTDTLAEMATLHRRFARRLNRANPAAWMDSWRKGYLRSERRR